MCIIAKYKMNELSILKKKLKEILGDEPRYFIPKIKYTKIIKKKFISFQKSILEGYLICFHNKFASRDIMNIIKYTKGINYILEGFKNNQKDIIEFVNKCKKFEDNKGFITQGFFVITILTVQSLYQDLSLIYFLIFYLINQIKLKY